MISKRIFSFLAFLVFIQCTAFASGPNVNIKYYGYDWLDYDKNSTTNVLDALGAITEIGKTNLNVVHTHDNLNSPACALGKCAVSISAGYGIGSNAFDICPGATDNVECQSGHSYICPGALDNAECQTGPSWQNIWKIASDIAKSQNRPSAIYFIDEPFNNPALQSNKRYVQYQYASYLCTLRQAIKANGMDIPVYTVLSYASSKDLNMVDEIKNGAPASACPTAEKSTPDWVGVDKYDHWSIIDILDTYTRVAPNAKWVLVPPSTKVIDQCQVLDDESLHNEIQLYWDLISSYPNAPVVYIMNWRFDTDVTLNRHAFPKSNALLSFMGNTITP